MCGRRSSSYLRRTGSHQGGDMTRTTTDSRVIDVGPKPRADQVRTAGAACALAWRRSGIAGSGRAARVGLPLAAVGTALIVVGHFASMPVRNQSIHETGAQLVSGIFGAGTVLSAAGLV